VSDFAAMLTPADLADLLDCEHRSILVQALAAGLPGAPRPEPGSHETAGVENLTLAAKATEEALRSGVPVIHRAVFLDGEFSAQADLLVQDGEGRYEVHDTTPVRQATPAAVVRLTACADAVRRAGWPAGPHLHLRLTGGGTRTLRVEDFRPLVDRLRTRLAGRPPRLPVPLWADERLACAGCGFAQHCASAREADRDLSLVAGMRGDQRRKLAAAGLGSIDALAAAGPGDRPRDLSATAFETLRAQAALQVRQDTTGEIAYEIVAPDELAALPAPAPGDVFVDLAGDPHALAGEGLEYLFGAFGDRRFTPFWAHSRAQERRAFEELN